MEQKDMFEILAKQSIVNGKQTLSESQVRAMVGAPDIEEEGKCVCGKELDNCEDAYSHMTQGY